MIDQLIERYPVLAHCSGAILKAYEILATSFSNGGTLLIAGNGGSAADAEHICAELMKGFRKKRPLPAEEAKALIGTDPALGGILARELQGALPAIALSADSPLASAYANDCDPLLAYAQQVIGYGRSGDVFFAISTSGESRNLLFAAVTAKARGMQVIALTGNRDSSLSSLADVCIKVPQSETYLVQELHLPVYHCLCDMLEEKFFAE